MNCNNQINEERKIEIIENKVIRILSWIFFLPVMLMFSAFKAKKFRIFIMTMSIITASLYLILPYSYFTRYSSVIQPTSSQNEYLTVSTKNSVSDVLESLESDTVTTNTTVSVYDMIDEIENDTVIQDPDSIVYVTKSGAKYHTSDCYLLKGNGIEKRYEEAVLLGYTPCKKCHK